MLALQKTYIQFRIRFIDTYMELSSNNLTATGVYIQLPTQRDKMPFEVL